LAESQSRVARIAGLCSRAGVEIDELGPLSTNLEEAENTVMALTQMCLQNVCASEKLQKDMAAEVMARRLHNSLLVSKRHAFRQLMEHRMSKTKSIENIVNDEISAQSLETIMDMESSAKLAKGRNMLTRAGRMGAQESVKEDKFSNVGWDGAHLEDLLCNVASDGGALLGAVGGVVAGATMGTVCGLVPAIFTFGLSIPFGAVVGGGAGLCIGSTWTRIAGENWVRSKCRRRHSMK
jgi:hypothetical protein